MKIRDVEILIVPGYTNSGPDHWQTRWEQKLSTARRVEQEQWSKPERDVWVDKLIDEVNKATKPVVLVAHSLGVATVIHAIPEIKDKVIGAFFVAPPDVQNEKIRPKHLMTFGPYPKEKLPFPTLVVASQNDPFSDFATTEAIAKDWGAVILDAGEAGHLNEESGHGPWPEGTMVFAKFISELKDTTNNQTVKADD